MATSVLARLEKVPEQPVLMILGDDTLDVYANTPKIKRWYQKNKSENFISYQCVGAKHEVDNEIEPIGQSVRNLILNHLVGFQAASNSSCSKL